MQMFWGGFAFVCLFVCPAIGLRPVQSIWSHLGTAAAPPQSKWGQLLQNTDGWMDRFMTGLAESHNQRMILTKQYIPNLPRPNNIHLKVGHLVNVVKLPSVRTDSTFCSTFPSMAQDKSMCLFCQCWMNTDSVTPTVVGHPDPPEVFIISLLKQVGIQGLTRD